MQKFKLWFKENRLEIFIFISIFIIIFGCIGSYPDVLERYIDFGIHPQINKVLDNMVVPGEITWTWQDMHQGQAGRSPIYGGVIELGIRLFGLTLFGIRIFWAMFAFLILILLYTVMRKYYPRSFSLIFITLFATSPWYLTMARSGGFVGYSLSLALFALSMVAFFIKKGKDKGLWIPIIAGVSVAILPYGYAILRPLFPLLILWTIFRYKRIKPVSLVIFFVCILAVVSIQFFDLKSALHNFFYARGESLIGTIIDGGDLKPVKDHIMGNINAEWDFLLGLNQPDQYWNPPIAVSFWMSDIVVYPKFLVPFFVMGLLLCIIRFFRKRSLIFIGPVLFFLVTVLPGTVMSAIGGPNIGRDCLELIPLYFFIAYTLYVIFPAFYEPIKDSRFIKMKLVMTTVFLCLTVLICGYQVQNYFNFGSIRGERDNPGINMYVFVNDYLSKNPNARILIREYEIFYEYGAYAFIRLLGGKPFQQKIDTGQIMLVKNENLPILNGLIKDQYFDIFITATPYDGISRELPELLDFNYASESHGNFDVYYYRKK
jgi:hypothetical protein